MNSQDDSHFRTGLWQARLMPASPCVSHNTDQTRETPYKSGFVPLNLAWLFLKMLRWKLGIDVVFTIVARQSGVFESGRDIWSLLPLQQCPAVISRNERHPGTTISHEASCTNPQVHKRTPHEKWHALIGQWVNHTKPYRAWNHPWRCLKRWRIIQEMPMSWVTWETSSLTSVTMKMPARCAIHSEVHSEIHCVGSSMICAANSFGTKIQT